MKQFRVFFQIPYAGRYYTETFTDVADVRNFLIDASESLNIVEVQTRAADGDMWEGTQFLDELDELAAREADEFYSCKQQEQEIYWG